MNARAIILFQIILVNVAMSQLVTVTRKDFTHVGSFRSAKESQENNKLHFLESDYYVSSGVNVVPWASAQQSCRILFGINATLVSIETVEEWNFLKILLESHGLGATYWTSGMFDLGARVWRWSSNNLPIIADPPWDNGHPASVPNGILRILITHRDRYDASWRTVQNSQPHRYICELYRPPTEPETCEDNDLIIVLDSSASIGSHNYKKAKLFAAKLFAIVTIHRNSRVAFLIYSDTASVIVSLNNTLTSEQITAAILEAPYLRGDTATHLAIDEAVQQFRSFPRIVPQNLVVITDGESVNSTLTEAAVQIAINIGVRPFAVGITPSANREELLTIANGDSDYVFSSNRCDEMESLLDPLTNRICFKG